MSRLARWIFVVIVVVVTAVFTRLGIWQMNRLAERKAQNAVRVARRQLPPLRIPGDLGPGSLPLARPDTTGGAESGRRRNRTVRPAVDTLVWRTVRLTGRYDWRREIVLRDRSWQEAPGGFVVTPLLVRSGDDSVAVLVIRGWLPAPDAFHVLLGHGRPDTTAGRKGVTALLQQPVRAPGERVDTIAGPDGPHPIVAHLDAARLGELLPYPVAAVYAQVTDTTPGGGYPFRVPVPALDNGPFLSYAIQWFALALISVVGGIIFLKVGGSGPSRPEPTVMPRNGSRSQEGA